MAYDRPPPSAHVVRERPAPAVVEPHESGGMLDVLALAETHEHPTSRRLGALAVLMTLVFAAAAVVGFGIYQVVSKLG